LLNGIQALVPVFLTLFSEYWEKHADVQLVQWIQAKTGEQAAGDDFASSSSSEEEDSRKVQEARGDQAYEKDRQQSNAISEESDSDCRFDVCNKFSALGTRE
jgi:hypothetical protein